MPSPIRPTDDEARALARRLMQEARFAALGVVDPETGTPVVSRVAVAPDPDGLPMALVSDLSFHTKALVANLACSLLLGEPGAKGDPLTHPRLSLQGNASFVRHGMSDHPELARMYLRANPKAQLYIGFGDFALMRLRPTGAHLNGGFGKAFVLTPDDLVGH